MASFVIHLAIGEEYIRKHKGEINNKADFLEGVIYPDIATNKSEAHFTLNDDSSKVDLKNFISKIGIDSDFNKGYFLHLYTDYMFHNYYFPNFNNKIYKDYDRSNKYLIEKYKVTIPNKIETKVYYAEDRNFEVVEGMPFFEKVIDEISNYNMLEFKEKVTHIDFNETP